MGRRKRVPFLTSSCNATRRGVYAHRRAQPAIEGLVGSLLFVLSFACTIGELFEMETESEWRAKIDRERLQREKTLHTIKTREVITDDVLRAPTAVIKETIKSPEEAIEEMRTWLRTGVAPDGTRMMTEEAWQWYQDYYQATSRADPESECLPEGSHVDYYYWTTPYLAHIGRMDLVMMHAQVNVDDGTHFPADRLRAETLFMKNLRLKAEKRAEVQKRLKEEFVREALAKTGRKELKRVEHGGQPLFRLPTERPL